MGKIYNTKYVADVLGLPRLEVIRRIRLGHIKAKKFGWVWVIEEEAIGEAQQSDWYKKYQAKAKRPTAATG